MIAAIVVLALAQQPIEIDAGSAFRGREWFATLEQDAAEARRAAVERIHAAVGARYEDGGTIVVRFCDLTEEGARRVPTGTHAHRTTRVADGRETQGIEFFLEFLANRQADLPSEIAHEMLHAIMREQMAGEAYERVPDWVREGLAVHVAGQSERLARFVLSRQRGDDPLVWIDGLADKQESFDNYAEYGLAIAFLAARREGALPAFWDALVRGKRPWEEALKDATGLSWKEFQTAALAHAKETLAPLAKQGYAEFLAAMELFKQERKQDEAERAFQAAIEAYPDGPWSAASRYFMGRCEMIDGDLDPARQTLRLFMEIDCGKTPYDDDAAWYAAEIEYKEGFHRETASRLARFVQEFPHAASRLPEAHARRAECLAKLGDAEGAAAELAVLERLYPDHAATAKTRKLLAK